MADEAWLRCLDTTIDQVLRLKGLTREEQEQALREAIGRLDVR